MTKAAVHTTIRELSFQISRREQKARELTPNQYRRIYDSKKGEWRTQTQDERKEARKDADAILADVEPLRNALSSLAYVIGKGLI